MKPEEIICQAANGNPHAQAFLEAYARRAHWVDDLADGHASAKWTSDGESRTPAPFIVAEREEEWLLILAGNPFFIEHRSRLVPAMVLALSAWVDSPKFTAEQESVLKAHWHEVVWLVAWLTGGWQKMRELASASREFDIEEQAPEPLQPRETPDFPMGKSIGRPYVHLNYPDAAGSCHHNPSGPMCTACRLKITPREAEAANGT